MRRGRFSNYMIALGFSIAIGASCAQAFSAPPPAGGWKLDPAAFTDADVVAAVGREVSFQGWGTSPDDNTVEYSWDFDGDGTSDFVSAQSAETTHTFPVAGDFRCVLTVKDSQGRVARTTRRVVVTAEPVGAEKARELLAPPKFAAPRPADGVRHWYALMINGGAEERFWTDVVLCYDMLTTKYGFLPGDIYLLNYDGSAYGGGNPNGMIDGSSRLTSVQAAVAALAARVDADDELFVWITDHGRGYSGPLSEGGQYLGYMDGRASVDPGDEPDFPESNFPLRSIFTGGDYRCNHGMNVWKVRRQYVNSTKYQFYRNKYVSRLDNVYIEGLGNVSDNDVYIEYLKDYALGDTNRDGYIDTSIGEVYDYDGDGVQPYDPATGAFDEGDWGNIDSMTDNYNSTGGGVPEGGYPYKLFDEGFQGKICIDLGYTGGALHVDGRDEDNAGLFDWMDVNQDGDTSDIVSVDESVCLYSDELYDDILADLLNSLTVAKMTIVAEPCMSGGLVEDLSGPNRIIATATIEDAVSWGNTWIRGFVAALHGRNESGAAVNADADENGYVSMAEAFNYASAHDYNDEIPQYDDNGDGISHTDPIPSGGDGALGAQTYLGPTPPVLHHFTWDPITPPVYAGMSHPVRLTARDSLGALVDFAGTVQLTGMDGGSGDVTIGTGTGTWSYPLYTYYHDARTQVIYLASEIGGAGSIRALSLDVTQVPGQLLTHWTIRMRHTSLAAYSTASWESTDWTVVYQNNESITTTGWRTFTFTTPFAYNGTDNLMIDFSFNNSSWTTYGLCRYSQPGGYRSVYYNTDSQYGDPLTWSGTTPAGSRTTSVPNIRLAMGSPVSVEPSTAGPFVSGAWDGSLRILQAGQAVVLRASDGNGHAGASDAFVVLPTPPAAADFDGDHHVDGDDFDIFADCVTGPEVPYAPPASPPADCTLSVSSGLMQADLDQDGDVDQEDFGVFQKCFTGPDQEADPSCGS